MEASSKLLKVAYISKAQGIKGALFVRPFNPSPEWPKVIKKIFIESSPYLVCRYRPHKEGFIFELESCKSREQAESFKHKSVFLCKSLFQNKKDSHFYLSELISFSVEVCGFGKIGKIQSFQSHKHQDYFIVLKDDRPILIPYVDAYIQGIDFSKKTIKLKLPENFLEVFFGE